jgi:hypothetical protein
MQKAHQASSQAWTSGEIKDHQEAARAHLRTYHATGHPAHREHASHHEDLGREQAQYYAGKKGGTLLWVHWPYSMRMVQLQIQLRASAPISRNPNFSAHGGWYAQTGSRWKQELVSMARSLSFTNSWLLLCCIACSNMPTLTQLPPDARRTTTAQQDRHPYCDDTEALPSCPCEPGSHCVDGLCLPVWEADCTPRCVPATKPSVLCHGNVEMHGVWAGPAPKWMTVRSTSGSCSIGAGFTWRVWGVKSDERERATLDELVLSTWTSSDANCGGKPHDQKTICRTISVAALSLSTY